MVMVSPLAKFTPDTVQAGTFIFSESFSKLFLELCAKAVEMVSTENKISHFVFIVVVDDFNCFGGLISKGNRASISFMSGIDSNINKDSQISTIKARLSAKRPIRQIHTWEVADFSEYLQLFIQPLRL